MLEFIFLLAGIAVGFTIQKKPASVIQDSELQKELTIAKNLNDSLFTDLQEAKQALWKVKQEKSVSEK